MLPSKGYFLTGNKLLRIKRYGLLFPFCKDRVSAHCSGGAAGACTKPSRDRIPRDPSTSHGIDVLELQPCYGLCPPSSPGRISPPNPAVEHQQAPKPHSPHRVSWYDPNIPPIKTLPRPATSIKARNLCVPLPCNFNLVTRIFKAMASAAGFYTVMAETYI